MKKTILSIAAMLWVFCIVPIAPTQAMPRKVPDEINIVSNPPNAVLSVFNHKGLTDMITELGNQGIKDTILTYDLQEPREITIAQAGKAETKPSTDNENPYVKRRGHGRSKMGDAVAAEDNNSKNEDDGDETVEDEEFGDDSAIKYNKNLKNSSGYNKDL